MSVEKVDEVADLVVRVADRVDGTRGNIAVRCGDSVTARLIHHLVDILRDVPLARRGSHEPVLHGRRTADGLGAILWLTGVIPLLPGRRADYSGADLRSRRRVSENH